MERLGRGADDVKFFMDKAQWKISDRFIAMLVVGFCIVLMALQILPMLASTGKLRGNKAMLYECKNTLRIWKSAEPNSPRFDFSKLSHHDAEFILLWADRFDVWSKTNFNWQVNKTKREIVLVYGIQFDNVPKSSWTFFLKNPAHAVGYSDGTTGLISPEQFTNLNLSGFVSLSRLATNSEFDIYK